MFSESQRNVFLGVGFDVGTSFERPIHNVMPLNNIRWIIFTEYFEKFSWNQIEMSFRLRFFRTSLIFLMNQHDNSFSLIEISGSFAKKNRNSNFSPYAILQDSSRLSLVRRLPPPVTIAPPAVWGPKATWEVTGFFFCILFVYPMFCRITSQRLEKKEKNKCNMILKLPFLIHRRQ